MQLNYRESIVLLRATQEQRERLAAELSAAQAEVARLTHALVAIQRDRDELAVRLERIAARLDEGGSPAPIGGAT